MDLHIQLGERKNRESERERASEWGIQIGQEKVE